MPAQTQESKRVGMEAFLDIYEEFDNALNARRYGDLLPWGARVALFTAYTSRME